MATMRIYLDTNILLKEGWPEISVKLREMLTLSRGSQISVVLPEAVEREVRAHWFRDMEMRLKKDRVFLRFLHGFASRIRRTEVRPICNRRHCDAKSPLIRGYCKRYLDIFLHACRTNAMSAYEKKSLSRRNTIVGYQQNEHTHWCQSCVPALGGSVPERTEVCQLYSERK
jgi:hypothetical protein